MTCSTLGTFHEKGEDLGKALVVTRLGQFGDWFLGTVNALNSSVKGKVAGDHIKGTESLLTGLLRGKEKYK